MEYHPSRYRSTRSKNLVGFVVGPVRYAVDIQRVREILNPVEYVPLPHAPPAILGVADHRGSVVPVVDLRLRFGLPLAQNTRRTKWVVVEASSRSVGFVVDAVTEVFGAGGPEEDRSVPVLGSGDDVRGIASVYKREDGLIFVLDIDLVAAPAAEIDVTSLGLSTSATGESA